MPEDAPQRDYAVRDAFTALRWIVRAGAPWRLLPHEFPPWHTVSDQTHRWLRASPAQPSAVVLNARTLESTPERSGMPPEYCA